MNKKIIGNVKENLEDYFKKSFAVERLFARLKKYEGDVNYELLNFMSREHSVKNEQNFVVLNADVVDSEDKENAVYSIQSTINNDVHYAQINTCISSHRSGYSRLYEETFYDLGEGFVLRRKNKKSSYADAKIVALQVCNKKTPIFMSTEVIKDNVENTKLGKKYAARKVSLNDLIYGLQQQFGIENSEKEYD